MNKAPLVNKAQVARKISEKSGTTISMKDADTVIDYLAEVLIEELNKGNRVQIKTIGKWSPKLRKEKQAKNHLQGGKMVTIPAKMQVRHRPSKSFQEKATASANQALQKPTTESASQPTPTLNG